MQKKNTMLIATIFVSDTSQGANSWKNRPLPVGTLSGRKAHP